MGMKSAGDVTVAGTVTVTEPITVDGTVTADVGVGTQPVSGTVGISGTVPVSIAATVAVDVTDEPARDLGKVDVASLDQYTPIAGRFPVDPSGVTSPVSIAATVQVDVTDEPTRDIGKVDVASLDQYTPVAGRLPIDGSGVTQPISGTVTANPATSYGKTITYVSVNQTSAGTTQLAAASASNKHKVVGCVLVISLLGTMKFTDGVGDLTGPMDIASNSGFVLPGSILPYFETGAINRALNLVTTLGAARGVVAILTEP